MSGLPRGLANPCSPPERAERRCSSCAAAGTAEYGLLACPPRPVLLLLAYLGHVAAFCSTRQRRCPVSPWSPQHNLDVSHNAVLGSGQPLLRVADYTLKWISAAKCAQ